MAIQRIALNTGGGDAPGLNAVIRAVVLGALHEGWDVFGIENGYGGLLPDEPGEVVALGRAEDDVLFGAVVFFIICSVMSKYSRHLEVKLSAGAKR